MNTEDTSTRRISSLFITIASLIVIIYTTYRYAYFQMVLAGENDYYAHVYFLISEFRSPEWWRGWMAAPHCMWHVTVLFLFKVLNIPLNVSAASASCLYSGFYYLVLVWFFDKILAKHKVKLPTGIEALCALGISFIQPVYFSFLDAGTRYYGSFSINPIHNPTHMGVRPFALIVLCLVVDITVYNLDSSRENTFFNVSSKPLKYYILLAVFLLLSVVMKPTFAEMFIPAVGLHMLGILIYKIIHKNDPGKFFKELLYMLLSAVPAIIYILIQYLVFFTFGGSFENEGSVVITKYLEVWSAFTDNVYLSILLGMSLPIFMLVIDLNYFIKTVQGRIAILSYLVGFIEAAFLGEEGSRLMHANFMWPLMSGMLIMWLVSLWRLVELTFVIMKPAFAKEETLAFSEKLKLVLVAMAWFLFIAGIAYGFILYSVSLA